MKYRKVTAVIRRDRLEEVERELTDCRVGGITIDPVKGFGEYRDFFTHNWLVEHVRIQVFTTVERVEMIVAAILKSGQTGLKGDGFLTVEPIERLIRIRSGEDYTAST